MKSSPKKVQVFSSRGAIRKFMNRNFPNPSVEYIYAKDKSGTFYPVITRIEESMDLDHAKNMQMEINTDLETA